jgi:hypothetical protein
LAAVVLVVTGLGLAVAEWQPASEAAPSRDAIGAAVGGSPLTADRHVTCTPEGPSASCLDMAGPAPVIPEAPLPVLLPITGAVVLAAVALARRRASP